MRPLPDQLPRGPFADPTPTWSTGSARAKIHLSPHCRRLPRQHRSASCAYDALDVTRVCVQCGDTQDPVLQNWRYFLQQVVAARRTAERVLVDPTSAADQGHYGALDSVAGLASQLHTALLWSRQLPNQLNRWAHEWATWSDEHAEVIDQGAAALHQAHPWLDDPDAVVRSATLFWVSPFEAAPIVEKNQIGRNRTLAWKRIRDAIAGTYLRGEGLEVAHRAAERAREYQQSPSPSWIPHPASVEQLWSLWENWADEIRALPWQIQDHEPTRLGNQPALAVLGARVPDGDTWIAVLPDPTPVQTQLHGHPVQPLDGPVTSPISDADLRVAHTLSRQARAAGHTLPVSAADVAAALSA